VRALNRGGRALRNMVRLDADSLLAQAQRRTRLDDFGGDEFREPMRRLLASYERDASLTLLGRIAAKQDVLRLLSDRLLMQEDRRRHPEIAAAEIRRPIFVTGLPRTGTTLLHWMLAQDPSCRVPLNWETLFPSPGRSQSSRDQRVDRAVRQLHWFHL